MKYTLILNGTTTPMELWRAGGAGSFTFTPVAAADDAKLAELAAIVTAPKVHWFEPMRLRIGDDTNALILIAQNAADQQNIARFNDVDRSPAATLTISEVAEGAITRRQLVVTVTDPITPPVPGEKNLDAQSAEDLQVEAAKAGVAWDAKASRKTMVERIRKAKSQKGELVAA